MFALDCGPEKAIDRARACTPPRKMIAAVPETRDKHGNITREAIPEHEDVSDYRAWEDAISKFSSSDIIDALRALYFEGTRLGNSLVDMQRKFERANAVRNELEANDFARDQAASAIRASRKHWIAGFAVVLTTSAVTLPSLYCYQQHKNTALEREVTRIAQRKGGQE